MSKNVSHRLEHGGTVDAQQSNELNVGDRPRVPVVGDTFYHLRTLGKPLVGIGAVEDLDGFADTHDVRGVHADGPEVSA